MGSENSKVEKEQHSPRNSSNSHPQNTRLYTEDDIKRILQHQRRCYDQKQLDLQNRIYPNLPRDVMNEASTSTINHIVTPSAPSEDLLTTTALRTQVFSQTPNLCQQQSLPRYTAPNPQPSTSTSDSQERFQTRNANQPKQRRNRSSSRTLSNKNEAMVSCVTCSEQFGVNIYQCKIGHSSCQDCKLKNLNCGRCRLPITAMRNITLEATLADMTIKNKDALKCRNEHRGCQLSFKVNEMEAHLTECPFNIMCCPVKSINQEDCHWEGIIRDLPTHLKNMHQEYCQAEVNKEMSLMLIDTSYKVLQFINIGPYIFLIYVVIDAHNIYMVAQHFGTKYSASKWIYELHIYQKKNPRRKFTYVDRCYSNVTPVNEIIDGSSCAMVDINFAKGYLDCGKLTYKIYIKKENN